MKNTKFFFFALFISTALQAHEEGMDCDTPHIHTSNSIEQLAIGIQIPNCNQRNIIRDAQRGNFDALCGECKEKFEAAVERNKTVKIEKSSIDLQSALLNELQKSLSANMMDIASLRSAFSIDADFSDAIEACSVEKFKKKLRSNSCTKNISLNDLQNKMAEELGRLLSSKPVFDNGGILKRENSKTSCSISDIQIMRAKALSLEEAIDDNFIEALTNAKFDEDYNLDHFFQDQSERSGYPFTSLFSSHPVFTQLLSPQKSLIDFLKGIPRPTTKDSLRASLYTQKEATSQAIENISKKCINSFKAFETASCNEDLKAGKVRIQKLSNAELLLDDKAMPSTKEFIDLDSEGQLKSNSDLMALCEIRSDKNDAFDLPKALGEISSWMPREHTEVNFNNYRSIKYENEIGSLRRSLCDIKEGKFKCEGVDKDSFNCKLYKAIVKSEDPNTQEGRLAKSSDEKVNGLLRSLIGTPTKIAPETKRILVEAGILPKNNKGEFVEQPKVPERQPEYVRQQSEIANRPTTTTPKVATTSTSQRSTTSSAATNSSASTSQNSEAGADFYGSADYASKLFPDLSTNEQQELSSIHEEIIRRLQGTQGQTAERKPVTKQQAREAVREAFKQQNRPLSATQERTIADQFYETSNNAPMLPQIAEENRAELTPGDSPQEKWRKEQELRALAGMYGARTNPANSGTAAGGSERAPASVEAEGNLSTVAINVAEDKVKLSLSELLNEKISTNDVEGQQLKVFLQNKKDFILQVNDTAFKVKFDQDKFQVVFVDGDEAKAASLKAQLEKFLNGSKVSLSDMRSLMQ